MKVFTIIFLIFISSGNLFSQNLNEDYMMFSTSEENSEYIEFKNDSILIRKPYYSGGCFSSQIYTTDQTESIYREYSYKKENETITIYQFENSKDVKFNITNDQYFENAKRKEVYVLRNLFDEYPDLAVIYNNKIYWVDSPESSNGVIHKDGKENKKLSKILRNLKADKIVIKIYKEYEAFEKFGFKYVFGIIEIKDKNKGKQKKTKKTKISK